MITFNDLEDKDFEQLLNLFAMYHELWGAYNALADYNHLEDLAASYLTIKAELLKRWEER